MKFCPNCGSVLRVQRKAGNMVYVCPKCGYEEVSVKRETSTTIKGGNAPTHGGQPIIVESIEDKNSLPKTKVVCPKCGNDEAYWWMQQTRSADEATTRFFRCTKCGHVWREYD